jgi:hypothetical protein
MKYLFLSSLSICFFVVCANCYSQNFVLGVRGGISIPNLTGGGSENPINTGYKSRLGTDFWIFAEYKFSDFFSLQPMIEYSQQGGKKDGLQAITNPYPPPQYLYANFNSTAKLNYLMVPILAKIGWNFKKAPLRFYISGGPFISFLVSAKQLTSGDSPTYLDPAGQQPISTASSFNATTDIKSQINSTNFGVEGNVGLAYRKGANNLFLEGGGNYGFMNIQKGSQNGKNNTGAATVSVGVSHWFGK